MTGLLRKGFVVQPPRRGVWTALGGFDRPPPILTSRHPVVGGDGDSAEVPDPAPHTDDPQPLPDYRFHLPSPAGLLARRRRRPDHRSVRRLRPTGAAGGGRGGGAGIPQGDFGRSLINGRSVADELKRRLPVSFELGLWAQLAAIVISVPTGVWSALKQDKWPDYGFFLSLGAPPLLAHPR